MNKFLILGGAALAFATTPALAGPPSHAKAGKANHAQMHKGHKMKGHAMKACPPGLAKKHNGCMPPGQAKKMYEQGYRFDRTFSGYTAYDRIPRDLRRHYDLDPRDRYIYDNNYIYRVDPTTRIVREVLNAIL